MNGAHPDGDSGGNWPPILNATDIYRLLDKPTWITWDGAVTSLAFCLRLNDGNCLSLGLRGSRSQEQYCSEAPTQRSRCEGIAHALAEQMRSPLSDWSSSLTVVQDEEHHACLLGLPVHPDDVTAPNRKVAVETTEYVGNELAKRVTVVWRKHK